MMLVRDGGDGRKSVLLGSKNAEDGIGSDMTDPKYETFEIHFDDNRGSNVSAAPLQ